MFFDRSCHPPHPNLPDLGALEHLFSFLFLCPYCNHTGFYVTVLTTRLQVVSLNVMLFRSDTLSLP